MLLLLPPAEPCSSDRYRPITRNQQRAKHVPRPHKPCFFLFLFTIILLTMGRKKIRLLPSFRQRSVTNQRNRRWLSRISNAAAASEETRQQQQQQTKDGRMCTCVLSGRATPKRDQDRFILLAFLTLANRIEGTPSL